MLEASELLMTSQEVFWSSNKEWIQHRLVDTFPQDGLRKVRTIFRDIAELPNLTFAQQIAAVRAQNYKNMLAYNAHPYLSPEGIPGLAVLWETINKTLKEVGNTANSSADKNSTTVTILSRDIDRAIGDLN